MQKEMGERGAYISLALDPCQEIPYKSLTNHRLALAAPHLWRSVIPEAYLCLRNILCKESLDQLNWETSEKL